MIEIFAIPLGAEKSHFLRASSTELAAGKNRRTGRSQEGTRKMELTVDGGTLSNLSARLDRLPITAAHRWAIAALAFAYFFELADLNTFSFAAPGVMKAWGIPVSAVALITSASFGGMFLGAVSGGRVADAIGRKPGFIAAIAVYAVFLAECSVLGCCITRVLPIPDRGRSFGHDGDR